MNKDQHTLIDLAPHKQLLSQVPLRGEKVLELGVGTGALTQLILDQDPAQVVGYEIDPDLCQIIDPRLTMVYQDLTTVDYSYLSSGEFWLISNPPYCLLDFIKGELIDKYPLKGIIMMVPETKRHWFADLEVGLVFQAHDFAPPTKPIQHFVLVRH